MNNETILKVLPNIIKAHIDLNRINKLQEIRIRVGRKTILKYNNEEIINYIPTQKEILSIVQMLCENSIYSYQSQMCNGFITLYGGHRVGITGNIAMKDNKISNINYISSLNFRIAREIIGISNSIVNYIIEGINSETIVNNTLIISPPGYGKTTLLRDLVRNLSNKGYTISLIDERGEIAAMYKGTPQNDVGLRTDVMDNVTKSLGMKIAIRTMSPQIIVTDEIGTKEDVEAINYGICSGVKGIFTAHANSIEDLRLNENLNKLYEQKVFNKLIFLEKMGKVKNIYTLDKNMYKSVDENM